MKKGLIVIFAFIILSGLATADQAVLLEPADGITKTDNKSMIFSCNATASEDTVTNVHLRINFNSDMPINKSSSASGKEVNAVFMVENIPNGNYLWNCEAALNNGSKLLANANRTFNMDIEETNHAPYLTKNISDLKWNKNENKSLALSEYFTDSDNDTLLYTAIVPPHIQILITGSTATLIPEAGWSGNYTTKFIAMDEKDNATSNSVLLTIVDPTAVNWTAKLQGLNLGNKGPIITSVSPAESPYTIEGASATFSVSINGSNYTVNWYVDNIPISTANGLSYTYQNPGSGSHTIMIEIKDSKNETSTQIWTAIGKAAQIAPVAAASPQAKMQPEMQMEPEPTCGDGNQDAGETCASCPKDAKCQQGMECSEEGKCIKPSSTNLILIIATVIILIAGAIFLITFMRKKSTPAEEPQKIQPLSAVQPVEQPKQEAPKIIVSEITEQKPKTTQPTAQSPTPQKRILQNHAPMPMMQQQKPKMAQRPGQPIQKPKADPLLIAFIAKMRAKGHNDAEIKAKLKASGWTDEQIRPGFP